MLVQVAPDHVGLEDFVLLEELGDGERVARGAHGDGALVVAALSAAIAVLVGGASKAVLKPLPLCLAALLCICITFERSIAVAHAGSLLARGLAERHVVASVCIDPAPAGAIPRARWCIAVLALWRGAARLWMRRCRS